MIVKPLTGWVAPRNYELDSNCYWKKNFLDIMDMS